MAKTILDKLFEEECIRRWGFSTTDIDKLVEQFKLSTEETK